MIVELKRLFQGSLSLEDFNTKALRLVKEADYPEGDTCNRVLRDTIISNLASDKICAIVIKEGKDVTLARVMEITRLEVSTQRNISTGCKRQPRLTTCSTARDLRRRRADPDPVVAVVAAAAGVAILQMMETLQFKRKWKETPTTY